MACVPEVGNGLKHTLATTIIKEIMMAWYVGRHEKDTDGRYNEAVKNANYLLKFLAVGSAAVVIGGIIAFFMR